MKFDIELRRLNIFAFRLSALLAGALLLSQCIYDPNYPYSPSVAYTVYSRPDAATYVSIRQEGQRVHVEPPLSLEENPGDFSKPEGEHVTWVQGRWVWQENRHKFLWQEGSWQMTAVAQQWVTGYWQHRGRSWIWLEGYWSTDGVLPMNTVTSGLQEAPPAPIGETPTLRPSLQAVWIGGHWGTRNRSYAWVPGYWEPHPVSNSWINGHWRLGGFGWYWVPGYWRSPHGHVLLHYNRNRRGGGYRARSSRKVTIERKVEDRLPKK